MVMVMMTTIHYLPVLVVLGVGGSRGRGVGRGGVALRWGVVQVLWGETCKYTDQIQSKNTIEKYSSEIHPPHQTLTWKYVWYRQLAHAKVLFCLIWLVWHTTLSPMTPYRQTQETRRWSLNVPNIFWYRWRWRWWWWRWWWVYINKSMANEVAPRPVWEEGRLSGRNSSWSQLSSIWWSVPLSLLSLQWYDNHNQL